MTTPLDKAVEAVRPPDEVRGAKRVNVVESEFMSGRMEGDWSHWAILAAKILRHPATEIVTPNLYRPDLELTPEQERNYTEIWDGDAFRGGSE